MRFVLGMLLGAATVIALFIWAIRVGVRTAIGRGLGW